MLALPLSVLDDFENRAMSRVKSRLCRASLVRLRCQPAWRSERAFVDEDVARIKA